MTSEPVVYIDRIKSGLRPHLNRVSHVVVNVSDLDRAVEFYEATLPVRRVRRINGPAQAYAGLGIQRGQCRGWVLENKKDIGPPGDIIAEFPARRIYLIEWLTPAPVGTPYLEANHVGIYRQNVLVSNLNEAYQNVLDNGGRPYGEPSKIVLTPEGYGLTVFGFRDPDGNTLEMVGAETAPGDAIYPGMMHHCNLNVRDLARSFNFYRDVIGLDMTVYLAPAEMQPVTNGSLGNLLRNPDGSIYTGNGMQFAATLFGLRGDSRSPLDVLQWHTPRPFGEPYRTPTNLGIVRIAIEVDEINAARDRLVLCGLTNVGPVEKWDMGDLGRRRVVIFRDPDGIMLELTQQLSIPTEHPPPSPSSGC